MKSRGWLVILMSGSSSWLSYVPQGLRKVTRLEYKTKAQRFLIDKPEEKKPLEDTGITTATKINCIFRKGLEHGATD